MHSDYRLIREIKRKMTETQQTNWSVDIMMKSIFMLINNFRKKS